ncbi:MAG: hypothetical protein C0483_25240 [Pirellula sp.]|nr:hypothetical protein [Pirellula sp.]
MLRYSVHLVLFTTAVLCGWQIVQQLGGRAQPDGSANPTGAQSGVVAKHAAPIHVAEAWQRYHEGLRRGIPCDQDIPPHPGVVAAVLLIISLRTLTAPLRRAAAVA